MRISSFIAKAPLFLNWGRSIHLISQPGIGKSSMVEQIAAAHGYNLAISMLANSTPVDVPGYVIPGKDEKGRMIATHTMPHWATLMDGLSVAFDVPKTIIFFDEFGQADPDTKKAAAEVILNKRIGKWRLHPETVVWMASNRASDRSGVTRNMDHIINRTREIHIDGHPEDLISWMADHDYPAILRAYVDRRQALVFGGMPKEQGPFCTPRSFISMCDYLMLRTSDGMAFDLDAADMEAMAGDVGPQVAADVKTFLELHDQLPSKKDVLNDPKKAKLPKGMDGQMVVVQMLAYDVTVETAEPIIAYVRRMSEDMAVTFAKTAASRNYKLLMTEAFTNWTADNHSLLSAVAALNTMGK